MTKQKLVEAVVEDVKSTDILILHIDMQAHSEVDAFTMAQALHDKTGAFVAILRPGESIEQLPEEGARRLWRTLQERFG